LWLYSVPPKYARIGHGHFIGMYLQIQHS